MKSRAGDLQGSLFGSPVVPEAGVKSTDPAAPLAERMRPRSLEEFFGQTHVVGPGRFVREMIGGGHLKSLLLWGPPGCGKTTLARLIAEASDAECVYYSAVLSGVKDLRAGIDEARERLKRGGRRTIFFVDEIHRFNKAQQDAFLPHVESGTITVIGATTENPSFEVVAPLLSRTTVLQLQPLTVEDLTAIARTALQDAARGLGVLGLRIDDDALRHLTESAQGDARRMLNVLESAAQVADQKKATVITLGDVEEAGQHRGLRYDKGGDEHYDVISAFIKSMRSSDPDAAVYWLMRMLEAGEDPMFIARRMVIFAAEDVGNADPQALVVAVAARDAFHFIGLPEGRIPLAQAVTYLASAPKSNASYKAMLAAAEDVRAFGALPVPMHLRNAPTGLMKNLGYGKGYQYAHEVEVVTQEHLPEQLRERRYYEPKESGDERHIRERLNRLRDERKTK